MPLYLDRYICNKILNIYMNNIYMNNIYVLNKYKRYKN